MSYIRSGSEELRLPFRNNMIYIKVKYNVRIFRCWRECFPSLLAGFKYGFIHINMADAFTLLFTFQKLTGEILSVSLDNKYLPSLIILFVLSRKSVSFGDIL